MNIFFIILSALLAASLSMSPTHLIGTIMFFAALNTEGNPAGIKAILSVMNICQNYLRLPLVPVGRTTMTRIQKAVEEVTKI